MPQRLSIIYISLPINCMHSRKSAGGFPFETSAASSSAPGDFISWTSPGEPACGQNQAICACNLNGAKRASGQKKNRRSAGKIHSFIFRPVRRFFAVRLRTAGPAKLACPEAVGTLLLRFMFAAFTAINGVSLLLSLAQREKNPRPSPSPSHWTINGIYPTSVLLCLCGKPWGCRERACRPYSSDRTVSATFSISSVGSKRAAMFPSRSMTNLVKFHLILPLF